MKRLLLPLLVVLFLSCNQAKKKQLSAQQIVDKAIDTSGGKGHMMNTISFRFRDKVYSAEGVGNERKYMRSFVQEGDAIKDIKHNDLLERYVNDSLTQVPDSMARKYANSVNSVLYFAQLPYGLNATAVHKKLLDEEVVLGKIYYKVQVTFDEANGGDDFEDVYVYWIDKASFKVTYLAYSFEVDGGGIRFREALNERYVGGIRFVDYNNYKPIHPETTVFSTAQHFEKDSLKLLSTILLEDIKVHHQ